ncbi:piggyBac transposable element-derived protein 2-like [Onthophagus taurus]|uniref:piggyBac transposable element-derived protein 2-like n=1 Tax=Onthophagus taurus TaxID=166361 RepID=UPI0039BEAA15
MASSSSSLPSRGRLCDLLSRIEENSTKAADVYILPPVNATEYITDEDSAEEDEGSINNLPGSILRQEAEVEEVGENLSDSDTDEEENISLAELQKRLRVQQIGKRKWRKRDINAEFPDWKATNNNAGTTDEASTAIDFFELFFDAELVDKIVRETNRYSLQKNRALNVCTEEIKCFIGILLYSGYTQVPRRRMFWENASDAHHEIVINGMKRDRFEAILSHFHLANNYELDAEDKYAKIRPLSTTVLTNPCANILDATDSSNLYAANRYDLGSRFGVVQHD